MKAASRKASRRAESVEWLLLRGATSLTGCCRADGTIFSLTHSGKITALNNSCTDTPLSLASADIIRYDSSRMDNMNLAMADDLRPFPSESCAYIDRKSTRLNSSHVRISYAVFCLKKKKHTTSRDLICI